METKLDTPVAPAAPNLELDPPKTTPHVATVTTSVVPDLVPSLDVTEPEVTTAVVPSAQATLVAAENAKIPRPKWVTADQNGLMVARAVAFVTALKANPGDLGFADKIMRLGDRASAVIMPQSDLYKRKVASIMEERKEGSRINKDLLQIKQALDQVNPAKVSKEQVKTKGILGFMKKVRDMLPDEVLTVISARSATIESTVNGLKAGLFASAEGLSQNIVELEAIYKQMLLADQMIAEDSYMAQLILDELDKLVANTPDLQPHERENIDALRADTTKRMMDLQAERAANQQFFLGSQGMARLTREQLKNIKSLMGLMERTVLANLGLRVTAIEMQASMGVTAALSNTIGETIADTGTVIRTSGEKMTEARSTANINLDGLRKGAAELEAFFEQQARANAEIIEKGRAVNAELTGMVKRLEGRTGNATPGQLLGSKAAPELTQNS